MMNENKKNFNYIDTITKISIYISVFVRIHLFSLFEKFHQVVD